MNDETEQQDHLMSKDVGPNDPSILGKVYPRSLLYLISGVCEYFDGEGGIGPHAFDGDDMPILGMDRFYAHSSIFTRGLSERRPGPHTVRCRTTHRTDEIRPGSLSDGTDPGRRISFDCGKAWKLSRRRADDEQHSCVLQARPLAF